METTAQRTEAPGRIEQNPRTPLHGRGDRQGEDELSHGQGFLLGAEVTLADYYLLPSTHSFGRTPEGKAMYASFPVVQAWRERMEALPTVQHFRAAQPPRVPIEHARKWAVSHRPKY